MSQSESFGYGPKFGGAVLSTFGIGLVAALCFYGAWRGDLGTLGNELRGTVVIEPWMAAAAGVVSLVIAWITAGDIRASRGRAAALRLTRHGIELDNTRKPGQTTHIAFDDITRHKRTNAQNRAVLRVDHANGRLEFDSRRFDSAAEFDAFVATVSKLIATPPARRAATGQPRPAAAPDVESITFPYKPKPWLMLIVALFFGAVAAYSTIEALTHEGGMVLKQVIHLGPQGATLFFVGSAALTGFIALAGLRGIWQGIGSTDVLTVTPGGLSLPTGLVRKRQETVRFDSVTGLKRMRIKGNELLEIRHAGGKLTLARTMFANKAAFERAVGLVAGQVQAHRSRRA